MRLAPPEEILRDSPARRRRGPAGLFLLALILLGAALLAGYAKGPERGGSTRGTALPDLCLDVNTASPEELLSLPGVGPALAANLVEHRSRRGGFRESRDLLEVSGIGPWKLARLEPWITPGGECGVSGSAE